MAKRRKEPRFRIEHRKIAFEREVLELHRKIKTRLSRHLLNATC